MKQKRKKILLLLLAAAAALFAAACANLDVVGKTSASSFEEVLAAMPGKVAADEENAGFALLAPDETARFIWSGDYSESPRYDVFLELDAKPFIDAGLDTNKLPGSVAFSGDKLTVGAKLGSDKITYKNGPTAAAAYGQLVARYPAVIGYHEALDHFGVNLGGGNMFEWAKDMAVNDKDLVFVLNPEPFISAGVDPDKVEGWVFAKVPVMMDGKRAEVDKLLKPFNLK